MLPVRLLLLFHPHLKINLFYDYPRTVLFPAGALLFGGWWGVSCLFLAPFFSGTRAAYPHELTLF